MNSSVFENTQIKKLKLKRFTAFNHIEIEFSPGINILIGDNDTGKTHILKVLYSACDIVKTKFGFSEKLLPTFRPYKNRIGKLVHRQVGRRKAILEVVRGDDVSLKTEFSNLMVKAHKNQDTGLNNWKGYKFESVYIPVKEMLAHSPGFTALYERQEIAFEEIYRDILLRAQLPKSRGAPRKEIKKFVSSIRKILDGNVILDNEEFFLRRTQIGNIEFTLLAEGLRKLALILLLIQNEVLLKGSILIWDEPEANLNPSMLEIVVEVMLGLQRQGVQIFLATHNYILLKWFDLKKRKGDNVKFFRLERDDQSKEISYIAGNSYFDVLPDKISDTYGQIYDAEIEKLLRGVK